ncbi:MAG: putative DNA binding domain-containing protein [Chitinivibrionales bacterium]|nr:putative DNA binding domain-containing protein [Chitinivibrionales bacterium]
MNLNADLCRKLLYEILPFLSILDPACGSGAFLVAAMKTLINLYSAVIGRIEFLNDRNLKTWLADIHKKHPSINYFIKKSIITDNLYGVDIMEEATEIAKLRLFLALVASASSVDELEPLPNIDFNIMAGNSLVGLLKVDEQTFEESGDIVTQSYYYTYSERLAERNRLLDTYRHASTYAEDLRTLRDDIEKKSKEVRGTLDHLLLDQFGRLGIQYQEATWDEKKNKEGKSKKRALKIQDIERLKPFHWGFEFSEIMGKRGGFDALVTNPPWEIFKPNGKEFFEEYSDLVTKKKMSIKDFEKEQAKLLKDEDVRKAWLKYLNEYPHVSEYYRSAEQYKNQISLVNGKKAGTDINLYKLFTEQCFNLLKMTGECGIVIPSGIYTDLGTKQLREMLFDKAEITALYGLSNEKFIFEGLHHAFKFCLLTLKKGSKTKHLNAAFRINPREAVSPDQLESFLHNEAILIPLSIELLKRLSPDSVSVLEFKTHTDIVIAEKMLKWPLLGEESNVKWNAHFTREFDMTNDSALFKKDFGKGRWPLYEGKMVWHFNCKYAEPQYWVEEKAGRKAIIGSRDGDKGETQGYQSYRIGYRAVSSNTNERTLVSTVIPPCFAGNSLVVSQNLSKSDSLIFLSSIFNSFILDWFLKLRVTTNVNMFYIYQLPVPRLFTGDKYFSEIVSRAARLICTTPEFDDLAREVGLKSHKDGVTNPTERAKLRAELDGIIAHLYELTEEEFAYILTTFPLVPQPVKDAALEQFRAFAPKSSDEEVLALIKTGEGHAIEFKETSRWDVKQNLASKVMEKVIVDTVAAFLNSEGGTLLIGVKDDKTISGLECDYRVFGKKENLRDTYENWLIQYLLSQYQKDIAPCLKVTFHEVDGKDICKIAVAPSPRPVYVKEGNIEQFFIRTGNSKKQLSTSETVQYCKQKWPS